MKYDVTSIKNSTAINAGGVCRFEFVPKEWLSNDVVLNIVQNYVGTAITLIAGKQWLKGECMPLGVGFHEPQVSTSAGEKYNQQLVGFVDGDSLEINGLMNSLPYHEYVVIYTGRNGEKKIIGNKRKGMNFTSMFSTGIEYAAKNSYTIQFNSEAAERAPYYIV